MLDEIAVCEGRDHWSPVKRADVPESHLVKGRIKTILSIWKNYSLVVNWITVQTLLAIAAIHELPTSSINFVLAFSQAELDVLVYMELPIGMDAQQGHTRDYVLRLNKSIYGLKQSSLNWFNLLSQALQKKGRDSKEAIESFISSLKTGTEAFEFIEQGSISHHLGVEVVRSPDLKCKSFELCQSFLINKIVEHIGLTLDVKGQENPI
eukprot:15365327-Ditylum_brightwellii.AAC.2